MTQTKITVFNEREIDVQSNLGMQGKLNVNAVFVH